MTDSARSCSTRQVRSYEGRCFFVAFSMIVPSFYPLVFTPEGVLSCPLCAAARRHLWLLCQHGPTDRIHNFWKHSTPPANFFYPRSKSRSNITKKSCERDNFYDLCNFLCENTYEYGEDIIRFSVFHQKSKLLPAGD